MATSLRLASVNILSLVILVTCLTTEQAHGAGLRENIKEQPGKLKDHIRNVLDTLRDHKQDVTDEDPAPGGVTGGSGQDGRDTGPNTEAGVQDRDSSSAGGNSANNGTAHPGNSGANPVDSEADLPQERKPSEDETDGDVIASDDDVDLSETDPTDDQQMTRLFGRWQKRHKKNFNDLLARDSSLLRLRRAAERIKSFNERHNSTYRMGLNEFSDWTFDEVQRYLLGYIDSSGDIEVSSNNNSSSSSSESTAAPVEGARRRRFRRVPTSRDWSTEGYVTSVKYQGSCAACWAFTAAAALEGAYKKRYGWLPSLSPQEFVECTSPYIGCGGGQTYPAIKYANRYHGLATLSSYPYTSQWSSYGSCKRGSKTSLYLPTATYQQVTPNSDSALLNDLANHGPIATAVSVADGFQNYRSGILPSSACGSTLNHAVLLVGYGVDSATGIPYWRIQNSWGTGWGESGYARINRNQLNACGLTKVALKVTVS